MRGFIDVTVNRQNGQTEYVLINVREIDCIESIHTDDNRGMACEIHMRTGVRIKPCNSYSDVYRKISYAVEGRRRK